MTADSKKSRDSLTDMEACVLSAMSGDFEWPGVIARRAGINTTSPSETASKYCIRLVKKGYAERNGSRMYPQWRRVKHEG